MTNHKQWCRVHFDGNSCNCGAFQQNAIAELLVDVPTVAKAAVSASPKATTLTGDDAYVRSALYDLIGSLSSAKRYRLTYELREEGTL